ncbi:hypothetical protein [Lacipirellula parvula]|uniref:Uncharacterized protein n=1 Tax=Lacipirellula parvula TaxID=2650471 RepID=A0A5K7XF23_9BACT|nr:hypothetical protein [Lacipirellula parvula]BBO31589.1 hypothetical protein PLANPX_1201 [Lacipirellula parvula]
MKPLYLLAIGVAVGWAASDVDWSREAVAAQDSTAPTADIASTLGNSFYLYTSELHADKAGVVEVPSSYQWSVEASWRGVDVHGNDLPDTRVMLRLYDPAHNFTALTAQMDLATAAKLQAELASIISKKIENPGFQHRPQLWDSSEFPKMTVKEIKPDGEVVLEEITN